MQGNNGKRRNRKVLYFNPPFSKNVQTKVGEQFLKLVNIHFPTDGPLRKILNPNTVKISYRFMGNFKIKIAAHNSMVKRRDEPVVPPGCNCTGVMGKNDMLKQYLLFEISLSALE